MPKKIIYIIAGLILIGGGYAIYSKVINKPAPIAAKCSNPPSSYHGNVIKATQDNKDFRRVLFTGMNTQLVAMSIPPGGEVGAETHKYTEQTLFFLSGEGEGELNSNKFSIIPGDVVVVVPGTEHNFWNTGADDLKIYTVYGPPNHFDGLIEATKAEADANTADEAIGETAPVLCPAR